MSGTNIECTKCGDVIEVTATSVVLPFICNPCSQVEEEEEGVVEAPWSKDRVETVATAYRTDAFYRDEALANQEELSDDTASSDNTIQLVTDLEKQLQEKNETIATLGEELANALGKVDTAAEIHSLNERLQMDIATVIDRLHETREDRDRLLAGLQNLRRKVEQAEAWEMSSHIALYKLMEKFDQLEDQARLEILDAQNRAMIESIVAHAATSGQVFAEEKLAHAEAEIDHLKSALQAANWWKKNFERGMEMYRERWVEASRPWYIKLRDWVVTNWERSSDVDGGALD